jgi:hypothetical protein
MDENIKKQMTQFHEDYDTILRKDLRNLAYDESALRNKLQIRKLDGFELPEFKNRKVAYIVDENGEDVTQIKARLVCIPMFEISHNPLFEFDELKKLEESKIRKFLLRKTKQILTDDIGSENAIYKKIEQYLSPSSKGILIIRIDLSVLPADDFKEQLLGFAVFEQIGACVIQ